MEECTAGQAYIFQSTTLSVVLKHQNHGVILRSSEYRGVLSAAREDGTEGLSEACIFYPKMSIPSLENMIGDRVCYGLGTRLSGIWVATTPRAFVRVMTVTAYLGELRIPFELCRSFHLCVADSLADRITSTKQASGRKTPCVWRV